MADRSFRHREHRLILTKLEKSLPVYPLYVIRKIILYGLVLNLKLVGLISLMFGFNKELGVSDRSVWTWNLKDRLVVYRAKVEKVD